MKSSELIRILKNDGWFVIRQSGSHMMMKHSIKSGQLVVPDHLSNEVGKGLESKILKAAGIKCMKSKKIEIIVERTKTGYSAYSKKYPVATTGKNLQLLKSNILKALNFYFEEEHKTFLEEDLKIVLDLPHFFEFYKVINAKALSERIGMNQSLLAQYIGGQKKPSASQVNRILAGVNQIGKELSEIRFML